MHKIQKHEASSDVHAEIAFSHCNEIETDERRSKVYFRTSKRIYLSEKLHGG